MYLGQLFALLTALGWAQNSMIYSYVGKQIGSRTVAHIRLWIAFPMIIAVHLVMFSTPLPLGLDLSAVFGLLASGFIGFFIADVLIFKGFVDLGPRETLVILTTSPIFSALLSLLFFQETLNLLQTAGILMTISGVIWVIAEETKSTVRTKKYLVSGVLAAFAGTITQALAMALAKGGMIAEVHPVSGNYLRLAAGLAGLIIYSSVRGTFRSDFQVFHKPKLVLLLAFAAAAGPVLGIIFTLAAMNLIPLGVVSALGQVSPVFLLPVERFIWKKRLGPGALLGTLLAISGSAMLFLMQYP